MLICISLKTNFNLALTIWIQPPAPITQQKEEQGKGRSDIPAHDD
jgi:hypothetical protein